MAEVAVIMGVSPVDLMTLTEAELTVIIETLNRYHGAK